MRTFFSQRSTSFSGVTAGPAGSAAGLGRTWHQRPSAVGLLRADAGGERASAPAQHGGAARFQQDYSRIPTRAGERTGAVRVQAKPAIDQPGDPYEAEADHVAERVMRAAHPGPQGVCECGGGCSKCRKTGSGAKRDRLQMKRVGTADAGQAVAPAVVNRALSSAGRPLDAATRGQMESRFGHDFSGVRVHDDAAAAESSRAIQARAYTVGPDVVFGAGQYAPGTQAGQRLLAHELAHVVQQGEAPASTPVIQRQSSPMEDADDAMERKYANDNVAPKAKACGRPSHCPTGFCEPYHSQKLAEYYLHSRGPWLLTGISLAVDSRVVPFWDDYLAGGTPPKNITADFEKDFTNSPSTQKATNFLVGELKKSLASKPQALAPSSKKSIDIATLIPSALADLDDPGSPNRLNFSVPRDIPGNLAGDIGKDETACPAGAQPSPFNDERHASGTVELSRGAGDITVTPAIQFSVKDTVDLCPGDCGAPAEQLATVPLSQFEATGIAGDVPFTVTFPAPAGGSFTIPAAASTTPSPAPTPTPSPTPTPAPAPAPKPAPGKKTP